MTTDEIAISILEDRAKELTNLYSRVCDYYESLDDKIRESYGKDHWTTMNNIGVADMKSVYHVSIYEIDVVGHNYRFLNELEDWFIKYQDAIDYEKLLTRKITGCKDRVYFLMEEIL